MSTQWSDCAEFTPEFRECCTWKECPRNIYEKWKYFVDKKNSRVATKIAHDFGFCTIIGNTPLPPNAVTSWGIKVLKSKDNNGYDIYVGVAPSDIDQDVNNFERCG